MIRNNRIILTVLLFINCAIISGEKNNFIVWYPSYNSTNFHVDKQKLGWIQSQHIMNNICSSLLFCYVLLLFCLFIFVFCFVLSPPLIKLAAITGQTDINLSYGYIVKRYFVVSRLKWGWFGNQRVNLK